MAELPLLLGSSALRYAVLGETAFEVTPTLTLPQPRSTINRNTLAIPWASATPTIEPVR